VPIPIPVRVGDGQPVTDHTATDYTATDYTATDYTATDYTATDYTATDYTATDHTGADTLLRVADQQPHVPGANADLRAADDTSRVGTGNDPPKSVHGPDPARWRGGQPGGWPTGRQPPERHRRPAAHPEPDAEPQPNL